ncbi:hypothetical protein OE88DRAFT_123672 [Heliocybe sulcata]|uniref:WD40 repeat-like protein n=1 Tax=Heliocybe sulcata TaxID=5364 RepID=A0A5C3NKA8_9AGAM|nr:hypothetical protein OE88DRAFT_123672 [Heliocybe sulcata]
MTALSVCGMWMTYSTMLSLKMVNSMVAMTGLSGKGSRAGASIAQTIGTSVERNTHSMLPAMMGMSLVVLLQPQENAHYCKEEFAPGHSTGAITWGRGPTSSTIFASSESANTDSGVHIAWDIAKPGRQIQKFIASKKESGDAMTINPSGKTLALFTTDSNAMHRVRLYDVGRKNCQTPIETIELEPFEETCNESCEVTRAIYSTDGIYLAVARSDDSCHLYDSRYLTRPVHQFKHKGESKASVAADTYGITEVQFVDSLLGSRTCLVTGGTDGCVRLWDLFKPDDDPTNGKIIAQSDYNVGTFAIGHPADGVQDLLLWVIPLFVVLGPLLMLPW